jgi:LysM repeat protein
MSVKTLASLNGLSRGEILHPGERLRLYTHAAHGADPAQQVSGTRRVVYTVRPGDSLWRIAHLFQVKIAQILAWNAISMDTPILAGETLTIRVAGAGG